MTKQDEWEEDFLIETDFDSSSPFWSTTLTFPRPSLLEDKDMELHFPYYDGRWSSQIKHAVEFHGASGLDLNNNWAMIHQDWSCPVCRRSKWDILRLSKRNILLAKLELHHDHITDQITKVVADLHGEDWRENFLKDSPAMLDKIEELIRRFDLSLICSECNAADGKVKTKFKDIIDSSFSFTAFEISKFINSKPHGDHKIDYDSALELWKSLENGFHSRLHLRDLLISELSKGHLSIDRIGTISNARFNDLRYPSILLVNKFYRTEANTERTDFLSKFESEFLARSTSRDSAALTKSTRLKTNSSIEPSDSEFENYFDPVSEKRWRETTNEWTCPCCQRSKREILRKSNKGKWTGSLRSISEFIEERDEIAIINRKILFPEYANRRWISGFSEILVCADCAAITTQLMQMDRTQASPYLTLDERRECLEATTPHGRHKIDFETAKNYAMQNSDFESASAALSSFKILMSRFEYTSETMSEVGHTQDEILAQLCHFLEVHHNILGQSFQVYLVEWLLHYQSSHK